MPEPAIQVDHLWKKFRKGELHDSLRDLIPALARRALRGKPPAEELRSREFWALHDVGFEVPHGQSLGIIGPNGAGKSTMLKVLSRIIKPTRGTLSVNGRLSALIEVGAGFHPDLTGRENIYLNGAIMGMTRRDIRAKEASIIAFSEIEEFIDTPVKRYSSGMMARLGFAVAAHMEPEILLIDEVLSVGDARFRGKCIEHMHRLLKSGITVVFISHILDQVRALCPNTIVLDRGRKVYEGPTDGAIRRYMEVLAAPDALAGAGAPIAVQVKQVRLIGPDGGEALAWQTGAAGVVQFAVAVSRPTGPLVVQLNISTIGGIYLGTATSPLESPISGGQGDHPVRFTWDPMPLSDGDYTLDFKIYDTADNWKCVWASSQPRTFSVRGRGVYGPLVTCSGRWELPAVSPPPDATVPVSPAAADLP